MSYSEVKDLSEHRADVERMFEMLSANGQVFPEGSLILDVGGGAGMHSGMLTPYVSKVFCTDFFDQHIRFGGEFIRLLHEKFMRNSYEFDLNAFEFHAVDAMAMIYRDNLFDMIVSFNAMEHIPDPESALTEMHRVLKPGALAYLTFDPIWTCDTGSHFSHRVKAPWAHLVMPDEEFCSAIREAGGEDTEVEEYRSAMNRKRLPYYREVFDRWRGKFEFLAEYEWSGCSDPRNADHENLARCLGSGYDLEELMFRGMAKLLRKPAAGGQAIV